MATPLSRVQQLQKISCSLFQTVFNPTGVRTGNSILRQRLQGPHIAEYYPRDRPKFSQLRSLFGAVGLSIRNLPEEERVARLERLRRRGKGAPKKGQGKRASMNKKK
ncbi:mitochondral 37S ribosomal protein S27 [Sorochytrium milnesiophthora]